MASTVWRGHLTFGLLSIPIRLFRAARAERIAMRRVARARVEPAAPDLPSPESVAERTQGRSAPGIQPNFSSGPVAVPTYEATNVVSTAPLVALRQSQTEKGSGLAVPDSAVTRAVEVKPNHFVEVPAEELKSMRAATSSDLAIQEFVALAEIDPLYFETSYHVVPEEVGEKAYSLLYQSLQNAKVVALGELSMHGRDHVVVIRPASEGLVAHTMFYTSETHLDEQFRADPSLVTQKELALAQQLISSLTGAFEPEKYVNAYQQKLRDLVASKTAEAAPEPVRASAKRTGDVIDIADALRQSLAQLKKPAQKAKEPVAQKAVRSRRMTASGK